MTMICRLCDGRERAPDENREAAQGHQRAPGPQNSQAIHRSRKEHWQDSNGPSGLPDGPSTHLMHAFVYYINFMNFSLASSMT